MNTPVSATATAHSPKRVTATFFKVEANRGGNAPFINKCNCYCSLLTIMTGWLHVEGAHGRPSSASEGMNSCFGPSALCRSRPRDSVVMMIVSTCDASPLLAELQPAQNNGRWWARERSRAEGSPSLSWCPITQQPIVIRNLHFLPPPHSFWCSRQHIHSTPMEDDNRTERHGTRAWVRVNTWPNSTSGTEAFNSQVLYPLIVAPGGHDKKQQPKNTNQSRNLYIFITIIQFVAQLALSELILSHQLKCTSHQRHQPPLWVYWRFFGKPSHCLHGKSPQKKAV